MTGPKMGSVQLAAIIGSSSSMVVLEATGSMTTVTLAVAGSMGAAEVRPPADASRKRASVEREARGSMAEDRRCGSEEGEKGKGEVERCLKEWCGADEAKEVGKLGGWRVYEVDVGEQQASMLSALL